jgi:hypothetical protein
VTCTIRSIRSPSAERFRSDCILKARIERLPFHVVPQLVVWEWPVISADGTTRQSKYWPFKSFLFPVKRSACDGALILDLEDLGWAGQNEGGESSVSKGKADDDKNGAEYQPPRGEKKTMVL